MRAAVLSIMLGACSSGFKAAEAVGIYSVSWTCESASCPNLYFNEFINRLEVCGFEMNTGTLDMATESDLGVVYYRAIDSTFTDGAIQGSFHEDERGMPIPTPRYLVEVVLVKDGENISSTWHATPEADGTAASWSAAGERTPYECQ